MSKELTSILVLIAVFKLLNRRVDHEPTGEVGGEAGRTERFERRVRERETSSTGSPPIAGGATTAATAPAPELDRDMILTLVGIATLIVVALAFDVDVGFVALSIAAVLSLISPASAKCAVSKIAWPTVLLICYVGGVVSAFASTTGILGALIPLAVPFLQTGAVGAVGLIIALSISSSVVDSSPFSTSGALTVANTPEAHRDHVFKRLMQWGMSMVVIAPLLAWLIFVVPGWL